MRIATRSREHAADRRLPVEAGRRWDPPSYKPCHRLKSAFRADFRRWLSGRPIRHPEWLAEYERLGSPPGEWRLGNGGWVLAGDVGSLRWDRWEVANGFDQA
jgi:hypothetical protein